MIQYANVSPQRTIYYQTSTTNKSFLEMHYFLKDKGIKNNKFMLTLLDNDLAGVDPFDPNLNTMMKQKVLRECISNFWYFLRECVRIPDQGGTIGNGGGAKFKLSRANMALVFCLSMNVNTYLVIPRQQGKTISAICWYLYLFNFGTSNSEMSFVNKKMDDSKLNLQRLKEVRSGLPSYLRMDQVYGKDGKVIKAPNSVETITHALNNNKIRTVPSARNRIMAASLLRGRTLPVVWFDEFAFTLYNDEIYVNMVPAYKTAAMNAQKNHAPYGILITTTPGNLTEEAGVYAYKMRNDATKFTESWYDLDYPQLMEIIGANTNSSFVYIEFTYQQLGQSEEWFRSICVDMGKDWPRIRREVLLEWSAASDNSPFTKEDLEIVQQFTRQPITQMLMLGKYTMDIYEKVDPRYPPIIGVDASGGYYRDSSAIVVLDSRTTRVTAVLNCNYIPPTDLATVVYELVTKYMPNAIVNVERNGGFGASILAKLVNSSIKKNLYYEIKDKVVEERSNGMHMVRKTQKTKVYGLDSTKTVRDLLIQILRDRMQLHKDKFISPYIYEELLTLEVKKNGKVEHSQNGHDDTIFAYLMALYVWYEGKDLMERWGLRKDALRTDEDLDEVVHSINEKYSDIIEDLGISVEENDEVEKQMKMLNSMKVTLFNDWMHQEFEKDQQAIQDLMSTELGKRAVKQHYHLSDMDIEMMNHDSGGVISKEVENFYNDNDTPYEVEQINISTPGIMYTSYDQF